MLGPSSKPGNGTLTSCESRLSPLLPLTRPAVAMGLLEMPLWIPVNEGLWGEGDKRQVNKGAIDSVFA